MYREGHFKNISENGTYKCIDVTCANFHITRTDTKQYFTHISKIDTSSGDMNEKVDHWLDSFENFHKKCIIMP